MTAAELALALSFRLAGWSVAPPRWDDQPFVELKRDDGATLAIHIDRWVPKGRVEIRCTWPKFADGSIYSSSKSLPKITCALARGAEKIALEIERRLLPAHDPMYKDALEYVSLHDRNSVEAEAVARRLVTMLGDDAKLGENKSRRGDGVTVWCESLDSVRRVRVDPAYSATTHERPLSVSFEVHGLDPVTAAEVLRMIQEDRRKDRRWRSGSSGRRRRSSCGGTSSARTTK